MANYNFKKFFEERKPIYNNEYVCNGHFLIKKSELRKPQRDYVNTFEKQENSINQLVKDIYNPQSKKDVITEFIPERIDNKVVIFDNNIGLKEEYYNFITDIKCRIFITDEENINRKPMSIYNKDNEFVGIVMPFKITKENLDSAKDYKEYIKEQEVIKQIQDAKKENYKKCLYISNNKAIVRNKELTCVADIVNDELYKNVYVEANYKKDGGLVFIDFGFILMYIGSLNKYDIEPETIKYRLEKIKDITLQDYRDAITKAVNNNQFINVAEIKLMELAGEPKEYIKTLTNHRQKVLDLKEQEHRERELKKQQEEQQYIQEKNKIAENTITEAEQAILNKGTVKNKDITIYGESRYNSKTLSIVNHLMKLYNIKVPLKTQGWINSALANIYYDKEYGWTYQYYKSSANSTVFQKYLNELVKKINKNMAM